MLSQLVSARVLAVLAGGTLATTAMGNMLYTQNFDSLPSAGPVTWANNSTLPNWYAYGSGVAGVFAARDGGSVNPAFTVDSGGSNAGGMHSYGATSERALGTIGSGGATAGDIAFSLVLQ